MYKFFKIDKVLCVQNYGTSGTLLTHSLLDGHPELLSIPGLYGHEPIRAWVNIFGDSKFIKKDQLKKLVKFFLYFSEHWFKIKKNIHGLNTLGKNKNIKIVISKKFFFNRLNHYLKKKKIIHRKEFFILSYIVFNEFYKRRSKNISYIVFPIHSLSKEIMNILIEDFKEIKVLHLIRNTTQNVGSLIKHYIFSNILKNHLKCAIFQISLDRALTVSRSIFGRDVFGKKPYYTDRINFKSRAIRLEDIHIKFQKTIYKLCSWLDIKWNNCLMKSTFMGFLWSNRDGSLKISGINKKIISQAHKELLNNLDKLRINLLTLEEKKHFKYINKEQYKKGLIQMLIMPIIIWLPFKSELIFDSWIKLFMGLYKKLSIKRIVKNLFFLLPSKKNIYYETFQVEKNLHKEIDFHEDQKKHKILNIIKSALPILFTILINLSNYFILRLVMTFIIAKIFFLNEKEKYVKNL
jgi:hypothetical protein